MFGKSLQTEAEENAGSVFPCPVPIYGWARELKNVAEWGGLNIVEARELKKRDPWFFSLISLAQKAEQEAEPIQLKTAQAEAEAERNHNDAANHAYH